jgi:glycosyltransferase involved in cell wall biosynthesis
MISVIIPVYNVEPYLKKCLDSVINQEFKDYEVIIINDGSTDHSLDIIEEYAKKYDFIKMYSKENTGLSDTRNFGIKKAKGKYLAFLDADDYYDSKALKIMYEKLIKEDLDIVVCNYNKTYDDNKCVPYVSNFNYSNTTVINYLLAAPCAGFRLMKKELFIDDFFFKKGIFYEDLELMPCFIIKTNKIGFVDDYLYNYYQRSNSQMFQTTFSNKLLDIFDVLDSIEKRFIKYKDYDNYAQEIEYLYITHLLRTASLRFVLYPNTKIYLKRINEIIKTKYPTWRHNCYYQKSSWKFKLICELAYHRQYFLLKLLQH